MLMGNDTTTRRLGIDTGGTFTDFIAFDGARFDVIKLPSTPDAPDRAVVRGIRQLADATGKPRVVHGSTVATNALLERKLARTVYVANEGLTDVLTIGRQARAELYNLQPPPQAPPVPVGLCLGVDQRTGSEGQVIRALEQAELDRLVEAVRAARPEAVAVNLLFSFLDAAPEQAVVAALRAAFGDEVFVCRSSDVLPEHREYERGIVTWLNAALGPRMARYLDKLRVAAPSLTVMHSAGGAIGVEQASTRAVNLLLSGPAGGLLGARYMGRLAGRERLLTLDMGGTSSDVALIDGDIRLTEEGQVGGYPVGVPMVDMHTIGAGGGSIAWVDAGGLLRVGPESAGAEPGPACYGKGGRQPTVTDAHVLLGRLPATVSLGGNLTLEVEPAERAIKTLSDQLGLAPRQTAEGILRVANEAMVKALRVISVERGEDPRSATLLSFGGAGGLHVCALAEALDMTRALVPMHAGVLSALGMLVAPQSRQLSRSVLERLDALGDTTADDVLAQLRTEGRAALEREGVPPDQLTEQVSADLRYAGQSFSLNLPWAGRVAAAGAFHRAHAGRYGHRMDRPVELVNLRLSLSGPEPQLPLARWPGGEPGCPVAQVAVAGVEGSVPVFERNQLAAGQYVPGPAIICEAVSTTWIASAWRGEVDDYGNILLERNAA